MVLWFCTFDFSFSFLFIIYLSKAHHSCAKEPSASAESSFRKENACLKVFLSWWKRPLLQWQRLSAGKLCLCKSWLQLLSLLSCHSRPHSILCLGGPAVYRQPGERGQETQSVLEKMRRGDYFWPGSVPWSSLPSRPANGWSSPAEGGQW